ncbi:uncharacterized protein TRIADDRAFT_8347, partial [Trichoplax adhaerens]
KIAGISGALAVALGAYGAHGLKCKQEYKEIWSNGNRYHMFHSIALLALSRANVNRADMAGSLLLAGMVVFSGSCYIAALAEKRSYGRLAPFGGTMMIIGWAVM